MSLSQQFLDELRLRTTLSALIGRTVRLTKAGNEFKACCPFHNEKSASFYVNDAKGFAHCFGCAWNGDAIKWLTEHDGLDFLDACRQLADAAGLEMPARDSGQQQIDERAAGLHDIAARAEEWFCSQLGGISGSEARSYLQKRGIGDAAIREFGIGFAPDGRAHLRSALAGLGIEQLIAVGLLAVPEDGREPYDRFRGRVIFPIHDQKGRTISFGGRIIGAGEPKYLNGPETTLFDKGRTLFNLHRAGPAARKASRVIVAEGYLDVIALAQIGIDEVVAPLGTALTEAQIERLWRLAPEPILCFDGDAAGQRASAKAAIRALPGLQPGRSLRFAMLPSGQDPDDIARSGGVKAVEALLGAALPLVELLWRHEHGAEPLGTPEARAGLRQRLVEHARQIGDRDLAREYESDFRRRVDGLFDQARESYKGRGKPGQSPAPPSGSAVDLGPQIRRKALIAVLRGLARFPDVAERETERIVQLQPRDKAIDAAIELILSAVFGRQKIDAAAVDELFPEERGWKGFVMSYLRPGVWPELAKADLDQALSLLMATQEGVEGDALVALHRAYEPPQPPEKGRLI